MKFAPSLLPLPLFFCPVTFVPSPAYPQGGGVYAYDCHHDRKAGGSFASKEEILKKLAAEKPDGTTLEEPSVSRDDQIPKRYERE